MSHYNGPYQPSRGPQGNFQGGNWSNQYHNEYNNGQDWTNNSSMEYNNYGTYDDGPVDQNYEQHFPQQQPTGWDNTNYPQEQQHNTFNNNHHPQRGRSYLRGGGHHPCMRPKVEPVEEHWHQDQNYNQGNYGRPPYHQQMKAEVEEVWDRDQRMQNNQQNWSTDHNESCHQPILTNLLQHIKTQRPYWQSRHKVKGVWFPKAPSHNKNNYSKNRPNAPTKTKDALVASSSNAGVQRNSIIDKTASGDDALRQEGASIPKNFQDKENNTPKALQSKSTSSESNAKLEVPKIVLQKSTANAKDWSVKNPIEANQQSSTKQTNEPSHSSTTDIAGNSSSSISNNLNQTNSDLSTSSSSSESILQFKECLRNVRSQKQQIVISKANILVHAPTLSAQDRELASAAPVSSNTCQSLSDLNASTSTSRKEVHDKLILNSVSVTASSHLEEKVDRPGPLSLKIRNEKATQQNLLSFNAEKERGDSSEIKKKVDEPGPLTASIQLRVEKENQDIVSTQDSVLLASNEEHQIQSSSLPPNQIAINIAKDANSDSELSDYDDDDSRSICSKESYADCTSINDESHSSCDSHISSIHIVDSIAGDTDHDDMATDSSGDEDYGQFSPSSDKLNSCSKRKIDVESLTPTPKKPKTVPEKATSDCVEDEDVEIVDMLPSKHLLTEEIIEISDDEDVEKTVDSAPIIEYVPIPIVENKNEPLVPTVPTSCDPQIINSNEKKRKKLDKAIDTQKSKARKVIDKSKSQKLPSFESTSKVTSKEKAKPKSPVKKSAPMTVEKGLPAKQLSAKKALKELLVKKDLQMKELLAKKALLLKQLSATKALTTPSLPSQQEASKATVDKSPQYETDLVNQLKYLFSYIYLYSAKCLYNVSLMSEVDDPKDLCNKLVHLSNESSSLLLQVKYLRENGDHHRITYKTLSSSEFDIRKMYKDFINYRRSFEKLKNFFVYTNLDLSIDAFKHNGVEVKLSDDGIRYEFSVKEGHELQKKFLNCLLLPKLADLLADSIKQGKQKNFNTGLIKKYHSALVKENVLVVQTKRNSKGKQTHVAKFHANFINQSGISKAAKELYHHLLKSLHAEKPTAATEFTVSEHFGKDLNLDPNPKVADFFKLADALVNQEPDQLLALKDELKKIVGHILQKEEGHIFSFSRQFFIGENLPGNLKRLRMQINTLLHYKKIEFLDFCNSKILIKDFCDDHPVQKLPDEDSAQLFKEFFKCFNFVKIQETAEKDLFEINDEDTMLAVQEELLKNIKSQSLNEDSLASIQNLISKCKVTGTLCQQLQPRMDIEFDHKVLDTLKSKIPEHDIVLCVTKSLFLTNLKVKQLCTSVFNFREGNESLFITNKTLLEMTSNVRKALAHSSTNLLVIQWIEPDRNMSHVTNAIHDLKKLVKSHRQSMKSVVVIIDQNHVSCVTKLFSTSITDNQHSFDLSEASKAKLLQADNISLQHRRISLKPHLLADEHVPSLLESPEILRQLLTGKLSLGAELVRPHGYEERHFKPQIKQCIVVDPRIFREDSEDVFIIRDVDRKDLEQYLPARQRVLSPNDVPASMRVNARFILLGFNVPASFFEGYADKNHDHNVHLLRYNSGSFVWEKTQGNNKDLLRNRLKPSEELYKSQPTEDVVKSGPKTVIICGESGSGKSVCLYELARKTRNLHKSSKSSEAFWPVQVNLDKCRLTRFVKRSSSMALERDFVPKFLCEYLELDETQGKFFTMIFHNELKIKLVLLFDAYESLPSSHRAFVVELLQELQVSYCERVYVTSTPSTRSELETALAVFAYSLEFSEVEKIQFLQSFWSKSRGDVDLTDEAAGFVENYGGDLTGTPLRLRMLAALYDPDEDDEHVEVETREELYKLYVERRGLKDEAGASLFSLRKILDDEQLKRLSVERAKKKEFAMPDDLRHGSFYEYFSAKYLAAKNHSVVCVDELLDSTSPLFLETYLARTTKAIADFAADGHLNVVKTMLAADGRSSVTKTMLARCETELRLTDVIRSKNANAREVVRFLLDHYNDTGDEIMMHGELKRPKYAESKIVKYVNRREKKGRKETPLEAAARAKNVAVACELMLKGASVKGVDEEFVGEIAKYAAEEMCSKTEDSTWLHPIAEKLFKLQPNAVEHLHKTRELPRLLSYFFVHGRVELVNLLLKNDRERYNVLEAKVDEKSPLDLVNESRVLSDDERLEIAKYIVTNVGEDLERRNKYYLAGVLKTAAECNHERTFEYFVGKYPDAHAGFLQSAIRSNRLDLIRFLMRKTDRMMYPEDNTALHKAVSLGVSPMTINFLVNRGGIDNKNKAGETPLCVAFKEGQELELVEYLVKKDAHLFAKDELGLYPWCHAILDESKYTSDEQTSIMKWLQEKVKLRAPETEQKISFESDRKRKEIARKLKFFQKRQIPNLELHMALKCNDESWIRFLILRGANVDHKEADGRTPLHVAVEFKRYKLAKMLLDHGAMFNVRDKKKSTPLELLTTSGDESKEAKEMKELLESATELFKGNEKFSASTSRHLINCRDKDGRTLLHVAAKSGNKAAVREIIKHSRDSCICNKDFPPLDVNAKDAKGDTPLNLVKNDDVAKELLVNGAIFVPATTPLLQSAEKFIKSVKDKDVERVRRELARNEYLANARDESGRSCLHWAASYDSREIVQLVLAVRASDVDAVDLGLKTPLHCAVESDSIASVVLLLKAGASYDARDKEGKRPFDVDDKANESAKLLRKIHEMFVDVRSDEPRILVNENPDALVEYLARIERTWSVPKDVAVNVVDRKKNTLLHVATSYDFYTVVENLLRQGAVYNPKNKWRKSPEATAISTRQLFKSLARCQQKLSVAAWVNLDPEIVVNFRNNSGYTLLYDCVCQGKKEEVRWLIENGADVKATSNRGTAISCCREKYPAICEMLEM